MRTNKPRTRRSLNHHGRQCIAPTTTYPLSRIAQDVDFVPLISAKRLALEDSSGTARDTNAGSVQWYAGYNGMMLKTRLQWTDAKEHG